MKIVIKEIAVSIKWWQVLLILVALIIVLRRDYEIIFNMLPLLH